MLPTLSSLSKPKSVDRAQGPSGPPVADVDAALAELHELAPTLLDVHMRRSFARNPQGPQLEVVLDRGNRRIRCNLLSPHGKLVDRAPEIGRFLGLREATASEIQDLLLTLSVLNPMGSWTVMPQNFRADRTWSYERIQRELPSSERLLTLLEDLHSDMPWLQRLDVLSREEGTDKGYTRLRRYVRFVNHHDQEVVVLDLAHVGKLINSVFFGDVDQYNRNAARVDAIARLMHIKPTTCAEILHDITLPLFFTTSVRRLLIDPPAS